MPKRNVCVISAALLLPPLAASSRLYCLDTERLHSRAAGRGRQTMSAPPPLSLSWLAWKCCGGLFGRLHFVRGDALRRCAASPNDYCIPKAVSFCQYSFLFLACRCCLRSLLVRRKSSSAGPLPKLCNHNRPSALVDTLLSFRAFYFFFFLFLPHTHTWCMLSAVRRSIRRRPSVYHHISFFFWRSFR